jgi:hypothetical protein
VSTLSDLFKKHGKASSADIEWLHLLLSDWQLVADLAFADLVLWIPTSDGSFIAAGHARPSSAATIFYRDISGEPVRKEWAGAIGKAFASGLSQHLGAPDTYDGLLTRFLSLIHI